MLAVLLPVETPPVTLRKRPLRLALGSAFSMETRVLGASALRDLWSPGEKVGKGGGHACAPQGMLGKSTRALLWPNCRKGSCSGVTSWGDPRS